MIRLRHDLLHSSRRTRMAGLLLLVFCGLWSSFLFQQLQRNADHIAGALFLRDHLLSRQPLTLQKTRGQDTDGDAAIAGELAFEWRGVVQALETPPGPAVQLLAADPDPRTHQLTLSGEGESLKDVLVYLEKLQAQAALRNVHLDQHQVDTETGSVAFVASATWGQP